MHATDRERRTHVVPRRPRPRATDDVQLHRDLAAARTVVIAAAAASAALRLDEAALLCELRGLAHAADCGRAALALDGFVGDEHRFDVAIGELSGNQQFAVILSGLAAQQQCGLRASVGPADVRTALMSARAETLAAILSGDARSASDAATRRARLSLRVTLDAVRTAPEAQVIALRVVHRA